MGMVAVLGASPFLVLAFVQQDTPKGTGQGSGELGRGDPPATVAMPDKTGTACCHSQKLEQDRSNRGTALFIISQRQQ